jgi:DNA-binding beta-propeller fold protein YncE
MRRAAGVLLLALAACRPPAPAPPAIALVGGPGSDDGYFALPRAAAWDPRGFLYVVDKTARIQKFDAAGRFLLGWSTPESKMGRPTGIAVDAAGDVLVADTHYHRILRYSPQGQLRHEFGREGRGPGEFIYPTGLAVGPDGLIYVPEYGGNDRIQVFSPEGRLLRNWGVYGEAPGEFKRPQSVAVRGDRLYVADAANHRIQVMDLHGKPLASWEDLRYPYGVAVDPDGDVLVAEYGRHRVARYSPEGKLKGAAGTPGKAPGELDTPWGAVSLGADRIAVVDAGNHRLQLWPASFLPGGGRP